MIFFDADFRVHLFIPVAISLKVRCIFVQFWLYFATFWTRGCQTEVLEAGVDFIRSLVDLQWGPGILSEWKSDGVKVVPGP